MHPIITIFAAFTRRWAVDGWLENLLAQDHIPALTNLCIIVDCDEQYIVNQCKKFAEAHGYRSFHVKINNDWHPNEVRLSIRRMRVADVKNQSKDLIAKTDGEIIVCFEDDTVFEGMLAIRNLLAPFKWFVEPGAQPIGFVEGVQMGRWGANMIGAWSADATTDPTKVMTLLPEEGYKDITAGGWYGYATLRDLYMNCEYYTSSAQPWGPDVNYGFWVRQHGYRCLIDWGTVFGHNDHGQIAYPNDPKIRLVQVVYNKDKITGRWERTDHEPTRY